MVGIAKTDIQNFLAAIGKSTPQKRQNITLTTKKKAQQILCKKKPDESSPG